MLPYLYIMLGLLALFLVVFAFKVRKLDSPEEAARRRERIQAKLDAQAQSNAGAGAAYMETADALEDIGPKREFGSLRSPDGPFWDSHTGDANIHYQGANYDSFERMR